MCIELLFAVRINLYSTSPHLNPLCLCTVYSLYIDNVCLIHAMTCSTTHACAFDWVCFKYILLLSDNLLACIETYRKNLITVTENFVACWASYIRLRLQKSYGDFVYSNYKCCIFYMINNQSHLLASVYLYISLFLNWLSYD